MTPHSGPLPCAALRAGEGWGGGELEVWLSLTRSHALRKKRNLTRTAGGDDGTAHASGAKCGHKLRNAISTNGAGSPHSGWNSLVGAEATTSSGPSPDASDFTSRP
jgi:hypothetical protein